MKTLPIKPLEEVHISSGGRRLGSKNEVYNFLALDSLLRDSLGSALRVLQAREYGYGIRLGSRVRVRVKESAPSFAFPASATEAVTTEGLARPRRLGLQYCGGFNP